MNLLKGKCFGFFFNFGMSRMYAKLYILFGQVSYNILCELAIIPRIEQTTGLPERWLPP